MTTFFDWLNSINTKTEVDDTSFKTYNPWMVNRGLSLFPDTVLWANEMNKYYHLDHDMQYEFLYGAVTKKKRFTKWPKKDKSEHIDLIKEYYGVSNRKAIEYLSILSEDQLELIKTTMYQGGRK